MEKVDSRDGKDILKELSGTGGLLDLFPPNSGTLFLNNVSHVLPRFYPAVWRKMSGIYLPFHKTFSILEGREKKKEEGSQSVPWTRLRKLVRPLGHSWTPVASLRALSIILGIGLHTSPDRAKQTSSSYTNR